MSFSTAAQNQGLLAAMSCNHPGGPLGCPGPLSEPASNGGAGTWDWTQVGGIFTINRSLNAPYFNVNGGNPTIGTSTTVARVGDQIYATAPGEAFPEVTAAIERSFAGLPGIDGVHIIDHASDQLGYYWDQRPGVYPAAQIAQSDFVRFNVGSQLAQDNVDAVRQAGEAARTWIRALSKRTRRSPTRTRSHSRRSSSTRIRSRPLSGRLASTPPQRRRRRPARCRRRLARRRAPRATARSAGTSATAPPRRSPSRRASLHTFPRPGLYRVKASVTDNLGHSYSWTQSVLIDLPLSAVVEQRPERGNTIALTARAIGGHFDVLAAHWTFSNGTTADGTTVTLPHKHLDGSVTITDGAGNTATTAVHIS